DPFDIKSLDRAAVAGTGTKARSGQDCPRCAPCRWRAAALTLPSFAEKSGAAGGAPARAAGNRAPKDGPRKTGPERRAGRQGAGKVATMFRSALLILSGNAFGSLMLLVRNLVVARLISVEDYGIAATFAIAMAIVEMITALGLHQLIVQDSEGNDPRLQSGLQGFHLLRGLFSSLVLLAMAGPIARFLGIAEVAWAYQVLAMMPAMNGLMHFDVYRLQRKMRYLPSILPASLPALLSVLMI